MPRGRCLRMPEIQQEAITGFLDTNLLPLLDESWKTTLSIFEIGCLPDGDDIGRVIAWMHSTDLYQHVSGLRNSFTTLQHKVNGDTVISTFEKNVEVPLKNAITLVVELFQVCPTDDAANSLFETIKSITEPGTPKKEA